MGKFQIYCGRKRETNALAGYLEKGRNDIIKGEPKEVSIQVGAYGIPNGTEAWGIRLVKGKRPDHIINVEDENYSGEIEFVKWGSHPNIATPIRCRYVPGYRTIDKDYQDLRLKVTIPEDSAYAALITLSHGPNEFDEQRDYALVQMLKVHHHNEHSVFCNPEAEGWMFKEIVQEEMDKEETKEIDSKFDCILLVNKASSKPDSIRALFDIVKGIETKEVNKDDIQDIYTTLKLFADQKPQIFSNRVQQYKRKVSDVFSKLESYNAIDLTKDGFIAVGQTKKEPILHDIPAKGKDMVSWAFDNFLEPEVYEGIQKIEKIADKLK